MEKEPKKICRVCKNLLFKEPILRYQNMPGLAQNLPGLNTLKYDKGQDLEIYQCSGCGLVQLICEPVPYFKEVIRAVAYSPTMREFRLKQFTDFLKKYKLQGKKILEIGCGKGEYMELMKKAGGNVYGIEYSKNSVALAKKAGLKVSRGFLDNENFNIQNSPFEAFFIISFFEHLPNPNLALGAIRKNITDSAVGIVEVPNFEMMLRENLFSEFMRDHLFYFTKKTLKTTLEINGFEVLEIKEVWHNYILSAQVKKNSPLKLTGFTRQQNKIKNQLDNFLKKYKNMAVWGAGHQAFAIMSIMDLSGKIKYIVDSAVFKQGKFSPATHIPIVAPETLKTNPVDALILMAGSYNKEIKTIIAKKFGSKIKTITLSEKGLK